MKTWVKYKNIMLFIVVAALVGGIVLTSIKAAANGVDKDNISQPEYITNLFNKDEIMNIDIVISEENWSDLCENATAEQYYPADVTVNGVEYTEVGIRAKGNTSLTQVASDDTTDRYSFKIKFDEYQKKQTLDGLDKIALNNIIQDSTYMKEYMSYDILNKMGVPTPAYQYANITINGEEWGLYLALEVIDESFIKRYYGNCDGNLYKPETVNMEGGQKNGENMQMPDMNNAGDGNGQQDGAKPDMPQDMIQGMQEQNGKDGNAQNGNNGMNPPDGNNMNGGPDGGNKGGMGKNSGGADLVYTDDEISSYSTIFNCSKFDWTTEADYKKVINMIKTLNEDPQNVSQYLDVDEVLRYFAVNTFLVNLDSYVSNLKHNYYLYEDNGVCSILPWDYNLAFGGFQAGSASSVINFPIDCPVADSLEESPLIGKLLEVDEYKEKYHEYLNEIVSYVESGEYVSTIEKMDSLISSYVENDPTKFITYDEYRTGVDNLKIFGTDRMSSIKAQLEGSQPSDSTGTIATNLNLNALGTQGGGGNGAGGNGAGGKGGFMGNMNDNNMRMPGMQGGNGDTKSQMQGETENEKFKDKSIDGKSSGDGSNSTDNKN